MDADAGTGRLYFDFVTLVRDPRARSVRAPEAWPRSLDADPSGGWQLSCRRSVHTLLPHDLLVSELASAGFRDVELYGAHDFSPFRPGEDESVIAVAIRT
jgi:hypothetical protein